MPPVSDTAEPSLRHDVRVAIDFEAEGLRLDGASDPDARLELLRSLEQGGFSLEGLREAAAHDRLALLPMERVLAGDGKLYTREELAAGVLASTRPSSTRRPARSACRCGSPEERGITEEELELSRSAKALLDAASARSPFSS